jgi:hypothetical protein
MANTNASGRAQPTRLWHLSASAYSPNPVDRHFEEHAQRLDKMILIMTIALSVGVRIGWQDPLECPALLELIGAQPPSW